MEVFRLLQPLVLSVTNAWLTISPAKNKFDLFVGFLLNMQCCWKCQHKAHTLKNVFVFRILLGLAAKVFAEVQLVSQPADASESRSRSGQECCIYLKL